MIEVRDLKKSFVSKQGRQRVVVESVRKVSFVAQDGAITGLLGANGAGKTTTLRMIAGLIDPDGGEARVDGLDVRAQRDQVLKSMGLLSDARGLYPRLSALENIVYYGELQGLSQADAAARAQHLSGVLGLDSVLHRRTEGFSQGERMKTALARALIHNPKNVILDEPTNGLDVTATRALREVIRGLRAEGKCVVISTHIMQEVERLCDSVVIIARGESIATGSVDELKQRAESNDFEEAFVRITSAPQPAPETELDLGSSR